MEGSLLGTTKLLWKGPKALRQPSKNTLQVSMISSFNHFSQHMSEGTRQFNTPSPGGNLQLASGLGGLAGVKASRLKLAVARMFQGTWIVWVTDIT